jgi:4,5-dihydroxyphthalate decarboxylase
VGIPEWAQTAAVYSRGFLVHEYGLDLASIHWVQAGVNQPGRIEKVDLKLPKGVKVERVTDKSLNEMLLSGEVDAVFAARPPAAFSEGNPKIKRFFDDYQKVESDYYKKTGIFPIMHAVAVRRDVLDKNPWVARNLFKAFDEARRRSLERVLDATVTMFPVPWGCEYARRGVELFGEDYFPYGIEPNRKTLEAFLKWAHEQGVCKRRLTVDELFPKQLSSSYRV